MTRRSPSSSAGAPYSEATAREIRFPGTHVLRPMELSQTRMRCGLRVVSHARSACRSVLEPAHDPVRHRRQAEAARQGDFKGRHYEAGLIVHSVKKTIGSPTLESYASSTCRKLVNINLYAEICFVI